MEFTALAAKAKVNLGQVSRSTVVHSILGSCRTYSLVMSSGLGFSSPESACGLSLYMLACPLVFLREFPN